MPIAPSLRWHVGGPRGGLERGRRRASEPRLRLQQLRRQHRCGRTHDQQQLHLRRAGTVDQRMRPHLQRRLGAPAASWVMRRFRLQQPRETASKPRLSHAGRRALCVLMAADRPLPNRAGRIRLDAPCFSRLVVCSLGLTINCCPATDGQGCDYHEDPSLATKGCWTSEGRRIHLFFPRGEDRGISVNERIHLLARQNASIP